MATPVGAFQTTGGNTVLVEHGGGGLTFTHLDPGFRFRIPWEDFPRFIVACYKASIYNPFNSGMIHFVPDDEELNEAEENYLYDPTRPELGR